MIFLGIHQELFLTLSKLRVLFLLAYLQNGLEQPGIDLFRTRRF